MLRNILTERRWLVDPVKFQAAVQSVWHKCELKQGWLMHEDSVAKPKTLSIRFFKHFYNQHSNTGWSQGYLRYTEGVDDKYRNEYDQKINQQYSKELLQSAPIKMMRTIYKWSWTTSDGVHSSNSKPNPLGVGRFELSIYPDGLIILEAEPQYYSTITPPDFVTKEITGDKQYGNLEIAKRLAL